MWAYFPSPVSFLFLFKKQPLLQSVEITLVQWSGAGNHGRGSETAIVASAVDAKGSIAHRNAKRGVPAIWSDDGASFNREIAEILLHLALSVSDR